PRPRQIKMYTERENLARVHIQAEGAGERLGVIDPCFEGAQAGGHRRGTESLHGQTCGIDTCGYAAADLAGLGCGRGLYRRLHVGGVVETLANKDKTMRCGRCVVESARLKLESKTFREGNSQRPPLHASCCFEKPFARGRR